MVPLVEQSGQVLLREDDTTIECKKHKLNLVKLAICNDVDLGQDLVEVIQSDLTFGKLRLTRRGLPGEDAHVVYGALNLVEGDASIGASLDIACVEKIVNHVDLISENLSVIKCAQKIELKFTHEHDILIVPLDLVSEIKADLFGIFHLAFDLKLILDDPLVCEQLLS